MRMPASLLRPLRRTLKCLLIPFAQCLWCLQIAAVSQAQQKIGVILPMSGQFAHYGDTIRRGLESVDFPNIELRFEDEGCDATQAASAYRKLAAADDARVFLGPWCGSPQVVVAGLLGRDGRFAITGSSAPRRIFEASRGNMFSTQHSVEQESIFNAAQIFERDVRRVVVLFVENDFSRAHESAFRSSFKGEILDTIAISSPDSSSLRAVLPRIKRLSPEALYVPDAAPLMLGLLRELRSIGLTETKVFSVYSAQSNEFLTAAGHSAEGLVFSYPDIEGDALFHFPKIAAQVLSYGASVCSPLSAECVKSAIRSKYHFDEFGVLEGALRLKTVRNGRFEWLQP